MPIKTSISFGLVYIPVTLQNAVKSNDIGFHLLHKKHHSRISYKKTCPECEGEVPNEDIVKGYEYEDGKYVIFDDEDFEKIKSKKDKAIVIDKFVDAAEIDPIYYDKAYYVRPAAGAERPFALLLKALDSQQKVGIAKTVLGTKDYIVALRAKGEDMVLSTMHFKDEVRQNQYAGKLSEVNERELELAKSIVQNMSGNFEIGQHKDEYREKVLKAIEQKIAGKEIVAPREEEARVGVLSLMDALEKSLQISKKKEQAEKKTGAKKSARKA
ncbi:MAG: Ku protein [Clostridiales bacterium]|jgi:DNA end-binding protein Ku|nr:Ku protein [Clostridiales bacterium]